MRTADGAKFRFGPLSGPLSLYLASKTRLSRIPVGFGAVPFVSTPLMLLLGLLVAFLLCFRKVGVGWTPGKFPPTAIRTAACCGDAWWASLFAIGRAVKAKLHRGSSENGRLVRVGRGGVIPSGGGRLWLHQIPSGRGGARWSNGGRRVKR